jgi:ATP-dependent Lhr-like helicase
MPPLSFHPFIREWFTETYGKPTAVQAEAWPIIEKGGHILALAPTGSGKTLTAFLAALSRFCRPLGEGQADEPLYPAEHLSVLYVSPLKALNEDIRRNLLEPLAGIRARFEAKGVPFPPIRVETRSGDTPQSERRRFRAHPPSILALTPESLAIILLNPRGREILSSVKYVILDEIHSVLGTKRGSFLSCQIDRLALIAGEFQRVSLSATVKPAEAAAEFSGGLSRSGEKRRVHIVAPHEEKKIVFTAEFPDDETDGDDSEGGGRYRVLVNRIIERTARKENGEKKSSLLVFTDSRRRAERLAFLVNRKAERIIAYAHHGSLSKEIRRAVEQRFADGDLPCVIATASLELGIDIGSVDEVILAGSPSSVSQALQRIGRSGHGVGRTSRGTLLPFHGLDLLLAAGLGEALEDRDIEETYPIENPLDVLAQIILALSAEKEYGVDGLYDLLRGFYVFRNLGRPAYDSVISMLAESYRRVREIRPRLYLDKTAGIVSAAPGTLELLYMSGGVIANRGYYSLRLAGGGKDGGTKIGELDEEFVWERRTGDCFDFGTRGWRITAIGSEAVEVVPLEGDANYVPFWKADPLFRSPVLAKRMRGILDRHDPQKGGKFPGLSESAAFNLNRFLDSQYTAEGNLPGEHRIGIEIITDRKFSPEKRGMYQVVLHTFRGGAVNYPLSLALAQSLEERLGVRIESFSDDNGVLLLIPEGEEDPAECLRHALTDLNNDGKGISQGERLLRKRLESSGIFGAAFREAAERSLLVSKSGFGKRTPLWIMRQRSKRLFDATGGEEGFPITAEAWRSCLRDTFDMKGFRELAGGISDFTIELFFFRTSGPSPFARALVRQEINTFMYEYDERKNLRGNTKASLSDRAIAEALGEASLRPVLGGSLVPGFVSRLRREIPGWAPEDNQGLAEWVKERIAIPLDEWKTLTAALTADLKKSLDEDPSLGGRVFYYGADAESIVLHREWKDTWENSAVRTGLLGPWLRYEGPVSVRRIAEIFGISRAETEDAVRALAETGEAADDVSVDGAPSLVCDINNLDLLLRLARKKARPAIRERPAALLAPFLALRQGVQAAAPRGPWESLACFPAPVRLWETEFFPARMAEYAKDTLDGALREGSLLWYGRGKERAGFCSPGDLDLASPAETASLRIDPRFFDRPRDFWEIKEALGRGSRETAEFLWEEAWKGSLSADSWEPVRRGLETGFIPEAREAEKDPGVPAAYPFGGRSRRIPRALREKWRGGPPVRGLWYSLIPDYSPDPFEEEELRRDRVRLLVKRWGILCRPLLEREQGEFSWAALLPAMRRMELAGELAAGRFFSGINSLQFAPPYIERDIEAAEAFQGIYWINAADPASPAGIDTEGLDPRLPSRSPSGRLCFRGRELIAVSLKSGKEARIFTGSGDPDLPVIAAFFSAPKTRKVLPERKIVIETINGKPAAASEHAEAFTAAGFIPDRGKLFLW